MKKRFFLSSIITISFLLQGCTNTESKAEVIKIKDSIKKEVQSEKSKEIKTVYKKNNSIINKVFKDSARISPNDKYMLIVFGTNTDPYSAKLKADIKDSKTLSKELRDNFSSYYLKAHKNLRHKLYHEGEYMDVDTKTLLSIYGINVTPTLIFTDKKAKVVIFVPGYMPKKQFLVTLNFIKSEKWKNKNRKNTEVYEALRNYYLENGIDVRKRNKK